MSEEVPADASAQQAPAQLSPMPSTPVTATPAGDDSSAVVSGLTPTLVLGSAIGIAVLLAVAVLSLVLVISLSGDMARLDDQLRKSVRAMKALEEEVAQVRELVTPPPTPARAAGAPSRPLNIDAADPGSDCVIRPGAKGGIANCL